MEDFGSDGYLLYYIILLRYLYIKSYGRRTVCRRWMCVLRIVCKGLEDEDFRVQGLKFRVYTIILCYNTILSYYKIQKQ